MSRRWRVAYYTWIPGQHHTRNVLRGARLPGMTKSTVQQDGVVVVIPAIVIPGEGAARGKGTGIGSVKRTPIRWFFIRLILLTFIVFVLSFWRYETIKRYIFPR